MRASTFAGAAIAALLALSATFARAQLEELKDTTPKQRATVQTVFMKQKLDLSAEQLPKVEAINMKYAEKMEPVIKGDSASLTKLRAMKESNAEKQAELQEILTPEQFQKYLAAQEEMRQRVIAELKKRAE